MSLKTIRDFASRRYSEVKDPEPKQDEEFHDITVTYCFGFIKRIIPTRFKRLKMGRGKTMNIKNVSKVEAEADRLKVRAETLRKSIADIDERLKTFKVKKGVKNKNVDQIRILLRKKKKQMKSLEQATNALDFIEETIDNTEYISTAEMAQKAIIYAGRVNKKIDTEKIIRDIKQSQDMRDDMTLTVQEIEDAMYVEDDGANLLEEWENESNEEENLLSIRHVPEDSEKTLSSLPSAPTNIIFDDRPGQDPELILA